MPRRRARVLGVEADAWGDLWDIRQRAPSRWGFQILQGWPHGLPRGKGTGNTAQWILTTELVDLLERHNRLEGERAPYRVAAYDLLPHLPFGREALKRLRRTLGHSKTELIEARWRSRLPELETLTGDQAAERYGVDPDTIVYWRQRLSLPVREYEDGWYLHPEHLAILASDTLPLAWIADHYQRSIKTIWTLRHRLRAEHGIPIKDRRR